MSVQPSRVDEDEDLDDLDDVVEQFSAQAQPSTNPNPIASTSAQPPQPGTDKQAKEWEAELAKEMESLLSNLEGADSEDTGTSEIGAADRAQLAAAWEAMLAKEMDAMSDPNAHASADARSSKPTEAGSDFQSRIRSTVDRRRERESDLHPPGSSAADAGAVPDSLESLLSQWLEMPEGGGVPEDEGRIQGILEEMMGQLMSKEVLYEPLKELHEKFPAYLAKHASTTSPEDKTRYEAQISCIKRLIDAFEAKTYRDDDENARQTIVNLMGELQKHGQPPEEIMGPLPPGFNLGVDGLPEMPDSEGCNVN